MYFNLGHYCRYFESARDYVINQCLTSFSGKDKAFQLGLAAQRGGSATAEGNAVKQ